MTLDTVERGSHHARVPFTQHCVSILVLLVFPAQPLRSRSFRLGEESELAEQRVRGGDQPFCNFNSLLGFVGCGCVCGQAGIFQLVSPTPQVRERPETFAKLCPHRAFHRVVTPPR